MAARISVCMITYNQESYLAEALEGVVSQRGDFDLTIVLGVDLSTDRTLEIAREYETRYPKTVNVIAQSQRVGMMRNFMTAFAACADADYVAVLEGDDRWTSPDKLASQLQFLAEHPTCSVCYHDVRIRHEEPLPRIEPAPTGRRQIRWNFEDFIVAPHWIHTCSVVYRNHLRGRLPEWMADLRVGDWPLHVLHASKGWVGRVPRDMAEYRVHSQGVWSGTTAAARERAFVAVYRKLDGHFEGKYHASFNGLEYSRLLNIACVTEDESERSWALQEAQKCAADPARHRWPIRSRIKRFVGYRVLRAWRLLAYGRRGGRAQPDVLGPTSSASIAAVVHRSMLLGAGSVAALLAGVVSNKAFSSVLGPEGLGIYALTRTVVWALSVLTGGVLGSVLVREGGAALARGDLGMFWSLKRACWRVGSVSVLAGTLLVLARQPVSEWLFASPTYTWLVAIAAAAACASVAAGIETGALAAVGNHKRLALTTAAAAVIGAIAGVSVVFWLGVYGIGVAVLAPPVVMWMMARRREPASSLQSAAVGAVRTIVRGAVPLTAAALLGGAVEFLLPLILLHATDAATVGLFRATYALAIGSMVLVGTVLAQEYYPRLSALATDESLSAVVNRQIRLVAALAAVFAIGGGFFAGPALSLFFSAKFEIAAPLLVLLLTANIARLPSWCLSYAVMARCPSAAYLGLEATGGVLTLGLSALGLSAGGLYGLGLGLTAGYFIYFLCAWAALARTSTYRMDGRTLVFLVLLAGTVLAIGLVRLSSAE